MKIWISYRNNDISCTHAMNKHETLSNCVRFGIYFNGKLCYYIKILIFLENNNIGHLFKVSRDPSILYVSIITVCRLFHIPIICLFAIYLPCDVHTCPIICILLPPFTLTLPVTYYFHLWCLNSNSNLNPITSKSVNLCISTQAVYPNG